MTISSYLEEIIDRGILSSRQTAGSPGRLFFATDTNVLYRDNGSAWENVSPIDQSTTKGKLTLESGVPISTSDQSAKATLYFTPYRGNQISIHDGTNWSIYTFSELSLSLAALSDATNYDIFIYNNSGTLTLESLAWSSATARNTALTLQDGIYVKSGDTTRKYLGTIRTSAAGQCSDTVTQRYVWNYYNRTPRNFKKFIGVSAYNYNGTWRQANADAANKVEVVVGMQEDIIDLTNSITIQTSNYGGVAGIGLNVTNANSGTSLAVYHGSHSVYGTSLSKYTNIPPLGYSYFALVERSINGQTNFNGTDWGNTGLTGYFLM